TICLVDPFHLHSHLGKDATCQQNNNPNQWPFLKKPDGTWRFNASATKIANAWYGGFSSICRGMHEISFYFFLESMVYTCNRWMLKKLEKNALFCCNIPGLS
ncbi:hypothetical protein CROQUDRAFT_54229, partial [Cronartium quercuum f. sp. fusiforme G11]